MEFTTPALFNPAFSSLLEENMHVTALTNGGYLVAWREQVGGDVLVQMQSFRADGTPLSGAVNLGIGSSLAPFPQVLDVLVTDGGQVAVVHRQEGFSYRLTLTTYTDATLEVQSGQTVVQDQFSLSFSSAQLLGVPGNPQAVQMIGSGSNLSDITVNATTGATLLAWTQRHNTGLYLQEAVSQSLLITTTHVFDFLDGSSLAFTGLRDGVMVDPDIAYYVAPAAGSALPSLGALRSTADGIGTPSVMGNSSASVFSYGPGAPLLDGNETVYSPQIVSLGDGRVLVAWVVDFGLTAEVMADGVYAQVFDTRTGRAEGVAQQIYSMGTGNNSFNTSSTTLDAERMEDGRVILGIQTIRPIAGTDILTTIIDARDRGVLVAGTPLADSFVGTAWNDTFSGLNAGDTVVGGDGIDTVVFSGLLGQRVDLTLPGSAVGNSLSLTGIENLTGAAGLDQFYGDLGSNDLRGAGGADLIYGRGGADWLDGGSGDDTLLGNADADQLLGGSENDVLRGGGGADDLLGGTGNDLIVGGADGDFIDAGDGDDTIRATDGADRVLAGAGNDRIHLGPDTEFVDGGVDTDTVILTGSGGAMADLSGEYDTLGLSTPPARIETSFRNVEHLTGTGGGDVLFGDGAASQLRGRGGEDTLVGGGGADTLVGGVGADHFVFTGTASGADTVTGFRVGEDKIALSSEAFSQIEVVGLATRLVISATAAPAAFAAPQLLFDNSGAGAGQLFYDADGNGAGAAVLLATLTFSPQGGLASFGAGDFVFV